MKFEFSLKANLFNKIFRRKRLHELEHELAVKIEEDTRPFVPKDTGAFVSSTVVRDNTVEYVGVQTDYLWNGKVMIDAETGRGAFYIPGVGFRFRRGAHTVASDRNLVFTSGTDHWMTKSKEANLDKWNTYAKDYLKNGFK